MGLHFKLRLDNPWENKKRVGNFYSHCWLSLWQNKKVCWNYFYITFGVRRSYHWQYFPVWNTSNNSTASILFGFGKLFVEFHYAYKTSSYQGKSAWLKQKIRFFHLYKLQFN